MVTFNKDGFSIQVEAATFCSHEHWLSTVDDIISALQSLDEGMRTGNNFYYLLDLLRAMMPDENEIKKLGFK